MSFVNYVLENFVMIFELIGLLIVLGISAHISQRMKRITYVIIILMFMESAAFYLEQWTQTFDYLSPLRPFLTYSVYTLYPLIMVSVMMITVSRKWSIQKLLLILLPEFISIPLYFTSPWTHLVCWFTPDNRYIGGYLSKWPYFVFGFYGVIFLIHNLIVFSNYSRKDRFMAIFVTLYPVLGVVYYLIFNTNKDYSALFTSAVLLYYIFLYIHMAKIDPLTSLMNRQSYYQDIQMGAKTITGVASVDMNELKYINDNMGHQAGDEALQTIGSILLNHSGHGGNVYRTGGDEFIILYHNVKETEITDAIADMRQKLSETPYSCAFGYSMVQKDGSVNDTIVEADGKMYKDKAEMKARGEIPHNRD